MKLEDYIMENRGLIAIIVLLIIVILARGVWIFSQ